MSGWLRCKPIAAALVALALLAYWFQWQTLSKFGALMPSGRFRSFGDLLALAHEQGIIFDAVDASLAAGILLLAFGLVAAEVHSSRLTQFLTVVLDCQKTTIVLLVATSVVLVRCYFASGEPAWQGDGPAHLAYVRFAAASLAMGEMPIWTNMAGAGTPYLQFYGVLFPLLVGLFQLVLGDPGWALKLVLGALHVCSGVGIYLFVSRAQRSRAAGLIAGLAYVASFWHLQQILIMGRLPLSLVYALLPWPFWAVEGLRFGHRRATAVCIGGCALGALVLTHPGYGFWAMVAVSGYAGLRLLPWRGADVQARGIAAALLILLALALSGYLTFGMYIERGATGLHAGLSLSNVPDPDWRQLLVWSNYFVPLVADWLPNSDWHAGYLGISAIGLAFTGMFSWWWSRHTPTSGPVLAMAVELCGFLLLAFAYRSDLLQSIPVVTGLNASRYLLFVTFFVSTLAGAGVRVLRATRLNHRAVTLALIVLLADLGSTTFVHTYTPSARVHDLLSGDALDYLVADAAGLPTGALPPYRLFTSTHDVHDRMAMGAAHLRGVPTFQSYHPGASRSATSFARPFERYLNGILADMDHPAQITTQENSASILAGLRMLNVRHLLVERDEDYFLNRRGLAHSPVLLSMQAGPGSFSELEGSEGRMLAIIEQTGVDPQSDRCRRILLKDEVEYSLTGIADLQVLSHRVWQQRVELKVETSAACFVRLAYSSVPSLVVLVDGERVQPWTTAGHFIALPLDAGIHEIVLQPRLSWGRKGLLAVGVLALLLSLVAVRRQRSQYRRHGTEAYYVLAGSIGGEA